MHTLLANTPIAVIVNFTQ
jgi:hypothetical protein